MMEKPTIIAWFISLIKKDIREFKPDETQQNCLYQKIKKTKENDNG